ncbi:hypothetical protein CDAR_518211 [Caerostris darwini]|uniref:Uncharacterized protein n=1 Tax=Caerostris darwini TaxID=1538125 RepID=A0AAV4RRL2_9ARAC|nr:hypothetical protein CDAR_518211 [Caerostris darwini]
MLATTAKGCLERKERFRYLVFPAGRTVITQERFNGAIGMGSRFEARRNNRMDTFAFHLQLKVLPVIPTLSCKLRLNNFLLFALALNSSLGFKNLLRCFSI